MESESICVVLSLCLCFCFVSNAVRWDIYTSGPTDNQIHWFSITNSSVIVMFLTVLVAMIMVRALRKDIQRYNAEVS